MKKSVVLVGLSLVNMMAVAAGRFSPLGISIEESTVAKQDSQYPDRHDYVYGWRLAFVSGAHSRMVGLATAVFANNDASEGGYVGGLQTAALFNTAGECELGVWQISGFYNKVSGNCNGLQVCTFYNDVGGYFGGLQTALYNEVKQDAAGMQIGLLNRGGTAIGMQIGLLNFAKSLQGVQLGLLNFVDDSMMTVFPVVRIGW